MTPEWDQKEIDRLNHDWWVHFWLHSWDGVALIGVIVMILIVTFIGCL